MHSINISTSSGVLLSIIIDISCSYVQDYDFKEITYTFGEIQIQLAVAMVSLRGVVVKTTTNYSSLLNAVLTESELIRSLYGQSMSTAHDRVFIIQLIAKTLS